VCEEIPKRGTRRDTLLQIHIWKEQWLKGNGSWRRKGQRNSFLKKKRRRERNIKGVLPDLHKDSDENSSCGFCGLKYCSVHYVQLGGLSGATNMTRGIMEYVLVV
jgi:hypothetical protein